MVKNKWLCVLLSAIFMVVFFSPGISQHYKNYNDFYALNDDARPQVSPFYAYKINPEFKDDYNSQYYLTIHYSLAYKALFTTWSHYFDPVVLSKIVPYITFAILLISIAAISFKMGGAVPCFLAVLFLCASDIFFQRMTGGLSRAFGFPLIALSVAFGMYGRFAWQAVTVVLGALFYPVAAAMSGLYMAALLLLLPSSLSKINISLKMKFTLLAVAGVLTIAAVIPQYLGGGQYGVRANVVVDNAEIPEISPGGRHGAEDRPPFKNILIEMLTKGSMTFYSQADALLADSGKKGAKTSAAMMLFIMLFLAMLVYCFEKCKAKDREAIKFIVFLGVTVFAYYIAIIVYPHFYIPQRYTMYALPTIFIVLASVSLPHLINKYVPSKVSSVAALAVGVLIVVCLMGRGNGDAGFTVKITENRDLYSHIETLPQKSIIAGWPSEHANNVNYLAKRPVLLSFEYHACMHMEHIFHMREVMSDFLSAYFAKDIEAIIAFRDKHKVTHMIVNSGHFDGTIMPTYFKPFMDDIVDIVSNNELDSFILPKIAQKNHVFKEGKILLIDLSKL